MSTLLQCFQHMSFYKLLKDISLVAPVAILAASVWIFSNSSFS